MPNLSAFEALLLSMQERSGEWQKSNYTIDGPNGVEIWTGNGILSYGFYKPAKHPFSIAQKIRFHFALKKLVDQSLAHLLEAKDA